MCRELSIVVDFPPKHAYLGRDITEHSHSAIANEHSIDIDRCFKLELKRDWRNLKNSSEIDWNTIKWFEDYIPSEATESQITQAKRLATKAAQFYIDKIIKINPFILTQFFSVDVRLYFLPDSRDHGYFLHRRDDDSYELWGNVYAGPYTKKLASLSNDRLRFADSFGLFDTSEELRQFCQKHIPGFVPELEKYLAFQIMCTNEKTVFTFED